MKKNAFVLLLAIFVIIVFSSVGLVIVSMFSGEQFWVLRDLKGMQALHLAEAGLRYAIVSLEADHDWRDNSGFSKNIFPGSFTFSFISKDRSVATVESTGSVFGINRRIRTVLTRDLPKAFDFGGYGGNQGGGPLTVQNSAQIDGDFYYNGDVIMKNNSTLINGTLYSNSLSLLGSATCASWEPLPSPPVPPPSFDASFYDTLLQETTKSASSILDLNGSSVLNLAGQTLYYTSIVISNNARVNGPGILVATTGNFEIRNSASLGDGVIVVVKGTTDFSQTATMGLTTEIIAFGDININNSQDFPGDNILYSKNGNITFINTSFYRGSILAPNGNMLSINATQFRGIIIAGSIDLQNLTNLRGSIIVNNFGSFSNNSQVIQDISVFPSNWPKGLEGSEAPVVTRNWQEVY